MITSRASVVDSPVDDILLTRLGLVSESLLVERPVGDEPVRRDELGGAIERELLGQILSLKTDGTEAARCGRRCEGESGYEEEKYSAIHSRRP
ncbi:MAG: hypothetical protein ACI9OJ_003370 [Myxococcota bacterium]|jgi:hypothetical protein